MKVPFKVKKINWTVLNVVSIVSITIIILYTIVNYDALSSGEGWGIVGVSGFLGIALIGLLVDFFLQTLWSKKRSNVIKVIIVISVVLILLNAMKIIKIF